MTTPHRCQHGGTAEEMCDLCEQPKATPEQAAPDEVFLFTLNGEIHATMVPQDGRPTEDLLKIASRGGMSAVRYVKAPRAAVGSQEGTSCPGCGGDVPKPGYCGPACDPSCALDLEDIKEMNVELTALLRARDHKIADLHETHDSWSDRVRLAEERAEAAEARVLALQSDLDHARRTALQLYDGTFNRLGLTLEHWRKPTVAK